MADLTLADLRSALHAFDLPAQATVAASEHGVCASELTHLGWVTLRGHAHDAAFMAACTQALGASLPTQPLALDATPAAVRLWISPDEWLLACPRAQHGALLAALHTALAGVCAQVVDVSGALAAVRLSGPEHLTVLRHLGPYDFVRLAVGQGAATVAAKAQLTVVRTDEAGVVLLFRRSFADYVWRLVRRAAQPYGLALVSPHAHPDPYYTNGT